MKEIYYKGICSDLDNTLLMPDKTLSPKTKKILKELIDMGVHVVPTTGRAFHSVPSEILEFPGIKYAIVSNGAAIYDVKAKEAVMQLHLPEDFAGELFDFLREKGEHITYECFVKGQPYTSEYYFHDPADFGIAGEREYNYVRSTRIAVPDIEEFALLHRHELDALDVIVLPPDRERIAEMIREHFPDIYMTTSVAHLIEISHGDSGKHRTMTALMKSLGVPMEQVLAFGDGDNDGEMLRAAGMGLAVANASPVCKDAADRIIGPFDQEAVAEFLEEIYFDESI